MAKHSINENYNGQTKLRHWWTVIRDNLSNLMGWYNSHIDGTADRHRAEDIDYEDSTVKDKINKIDMSLFKKTAKLPDEILTPGFYYGGGAIDGTLGGSGTYWFAIEVYPVFTNLLQILHQNVNGEWTTYYRNVSGLESSEPQFTKWIILAKISDVTALRTEVINQINLKADKSEVGSLSDIRLNVTSITDAINTLVDTDEDTINLIGNTQDLTTVTKENVVEAVNEVNQNMTSVADNLSQKADKVTNGGFIAGGAEAGEVENISIGNGIASTGAYGVVIGSGAEGASNCVAIGRTTTAAADNAVAIGYGAKSLADNAVQIGDGSNSDKGTMKFRGYKIVSCDFTDNEYYINDVGRLSRLYTTNQSSIVEAINELSMNKGNNASKAVLGEALSKSEEFNIWQNGNWIVGYSISPITITDDTYGTFTLPSQILEVSGVKDKIGEEKKYCYASYILNTDNLSRELSASDVTVTYSLKEAKGKPNSYMEIEDETKLTTINIYLGTITLNAENDLLPDGSNSVIYSGSEITNEDVEIKLLRIFNISGIITGEFVEVTSDEVNALF